MAVGMSTHRSSEDTYQAYYPWKVAEENIGKGTSPKGRGAEKPSTPVSAGPAPSGPEMGTTSISGTVSGGNTRLSKKSMKGRALSQHPKENLAAKCAFRKGPICKRGE